MCMKHTNIRVMPGLNCCANRKRRPTAGNKWLKLKVIIQGNSTLLFVFLLYNALGALAFYYTEGIHEKAAREEFITNITKARTKTLQTLWNYSGNPITDKKNWTVLAEQLLSTLQQNVVAGYRNKVIDDDGKTLHANHWDFWGSMFFCETLYTTIGYGHIVPATRAGRVITIIYSTFGIPLTVVLLARMGKLLARGVNALSHYIKRGYYRGLCRGVRKIKPVQFIEKTLDMDSKIDLASESNFEVEAVNDGQDGAVISSKANDEQANYQSQEDIERQKLEMDYKVSFPLALIVLILYFLAGTLLFAHIGTRWAYFDSFYFCFTTFTTIGLGDQVPRKVDSYFLIFGSIYVLLGLSIFSMGVNVIIETFYTTYDKAKTRISNKMADIKTKLFVVGQFEKKVHGNPTRCHDVTLRDKVTKSVRKFLKHKHEQQHEVSEDLIVEIKGEAPGETTRTYHQISQIPSTRSNYSNNSEIIAKNGYVNPNDDLNEETTGVRLQLKDDVNVADDMTRVEQFENEEDMGKQSSV